MTDSTLTISDVNKRDLYSLPQNSLVNLVLSLRSAVVYREGILERRNRRIRELEAKIDSLRDDLGHIVCDLEAENEELRAEIDMLRAELGEVAYG